MKIKHKIKKFCKDYSKEIIVGTIVGVGAAIIGESIYNRGFNKGRNYGSIRGFNKANEWWDEHYDLGLCDLWEKYSNENPDKVLLVDKRGNLFKQ